MLHGAGEAAFCSGADLNGLATLTDLSATASADAARHGSGPMGGTRIVQTKPVITVTQGYTYAGGLELFCHGHIRLAEPQATFSVACRRWGVPLVNGGTVYLPRLIGWGAALPLIITGQRISAEARVSSRARVGDRAARRRAGAGDVDGAADLPATARCDAGRLGLGAGRLAFAARRGAGARSGESTAGDA